MSNADIDSDAATAIMYMVASRGTRTRIDHMAGERTLCGACGVSQDANPSRCWRCGSMLFTYKAALQATRKAIKRWRSFDDTRRSDFLIAVRAKPWPSIDFLDYDDGHYVDSDAQAERRQLGISAL